MDRETAYHIVGKHIYTARLKRGDDRTIVILADTMTEATEKATQYFGSEAVIVEKIWKTDYPQVYLAWSSELGG